MRLSFEVNYLWRHIVLRADGLEAGGNTYSDGEKVWRHPLLLRIRLKLALRRIMRRNAKLVAFWKYNAV